MNIATDKKIVKFLLVTFGWTWLIGAVLYLLDIKMDSVVGIAILALFYMPAPFFAALIAEKRLVRDRLRIPSGRSSAAVFLFAPAIVIAAFMILYFTSVYLFGNLLSIEGFGVLATTEQELMKGAAQLLGEAAVEEAGTPPPPILLLLVSLWGAFVAGWTINGLFALGEEYGWRGLLWEELKSLGVVRANIVIGFIWGLWHAPLTMQGYNYPGQPMLGVVMMVIFAVCFSFVLSGLRERTDSVLPAAAAHGMFNALAVLGLMFLLDGNALIAGPLGVIGSVIFLLIGSLVWKYTNSRDECATK